MPEKEGAEEKSTKSVVNKKQKQMMGEEGYDHLRDQGRIRKNKKKKDATTLPVSDEVKKTQKKNKGPSALELVKKKYKGQIMDVKKEELDLTKVAESFGGYIVEKKEKKIGSVRPGEKEATKNLIRTQADKPKLSPAAEKRLSKISNPTKITDQNFERLKKRVSGKLSADADDLNTVANRTKSGSQPRVETGTYNYSKNKPKVTTSKTPTFDVDKKGQGRFDLGDTSTTGDPISTKKKRALKTPKKSGGRQLQIKDLTKQGRRSADKLTAKGLERVRKQVATSAAKETAEKAAKSAAVKQARKQIAKGAAKTVVKKAAAKGAAKFAAKRIPGIGAAISGAEAIGRAASGDFVGAALAAGEGILSSIPGAGTAASAGLGAVSAARDARRAMKVGSKLTKSTKAAYKTARKVTKKYKSPTGVTKSFKGDPKKFGVDTTPTGKKVKDYLFKDLPGTGKNRTKDLVFGKTRFGRGLRVGATADRIKKFVGKVPKPKSPDGSHVGRRTAG